MVRITQVTTRTGDKGSTRLSDGRSVLKSSAIMQAVGDIDELNSYIGTIRAEMALEGQLAAQLERIHHDLFDLGSDVASPIGVSFEDKVPRITVQVIDRLEQWIADATADLQPLKSFILPGGSPLAARLHLARSMARRAERSTMAGLDEIERPEDKRLFPIQYLNRLSDLFFQLARQANDNGANDVLWQPRKQD